MGANGFPGFDNCYLTDEEAAEVLGMSVAKVKELVKKGVLKVDPVVRAGHKRRHLRRDVDAYRAQVQQAV
jgi:excisionase family DNA binding protein